MRAGGVNSPRSWEGGKLSVHGPGAYHQSMVRGGACQQSMDWEGGQQSPEQKKMPVKTLPFLVLRTWLVIKHFNSIF